MSTPPRAPAADAAPDAVAPLPVAQHALDPQRLSSEQLFAGATELLIDHHGAVYRLRHTSSGKLILTK